jgi:pyrroline-5-carboxylate reductase
VKQWPLRCSKSQAKPDVTTKAEADGSVLLIGAGRMGGAMLKGWLGAKSFSSIHVVEPKPSAVLRRLAKEKKISLSTALRLEAGKDISAAVLAIKPQILREEAELLGALGESGALVLSIAAGITTRALRARLKAEVPIVRAMPNTPGAIGRGITALYSPKKLKRGQRVLVQQLISALGESIWVGEEKLIDAVTAVSGSGPAYVFLFAEVLAAAACERGLDAVTADKLARATITGAGALLEQDKRSAAMLRQEVTSPGGTTEAALKILMGRDGLRPILRRAVKAAARRSKELGK